MTGTSTKPVPVQQLKILYGKYGTRPNKVKSLMRATPGTVAAPLRGNGQRKGPGGCPPGPHVYCCVLLQSCYPDCFGRTVTVMTTGPVEAGEMHPSATSPA